MVKKITKTVELCDRCEREIETTSLTFTCPVCKRYCCSHCRDLLSKYPDVCRDCLKLPEVKALQDKFYKLFYKRYHQEEEKLKKLKIKKPKKCA